MESILHTSSSFVITQTLSTFLRSSYTTFRNFIAASLALRKRRAIQFLTTLQQIFIATSFDPQISWNLLSLFSKACLKIPQLLPTFQKAKFVTLPVLKRLHCLLFSTIKN